MSTEILIKEDLYKAKLDPAKSNKIRSGPRFSNSSLNKVSDKTVNKKKSKICINILQDKLREKEVKKKFENRIAYGVFISVVAVLFYVST